MRFLALLRRLVAVSCLVLVAAPAPAQDALAQFSSDLLAHESRQVLRSGRPLRYEDGEEGAQLRRLLDPKRTLSVAEALHDATVAGRAVPDINQQAKPLWDRYQKAFQEAPSAYEEEYLDVLYWFVQNLRLSLREFARPTMPASAPAAPQMQQLLAVSRDLLVAVTRGLEQQIRQRADSGVFSDDGRMRALFLADEIAEAREAVAPKPVPAPARLRLVYGGEDAYRRACAACHDTGAAGAPRRNDRMTWQRLSVRGLDPLVKSAMVGKGAMPPRGGLMELDDVEVARATAYLANSGGVGFQEPELPPGHAGMVTDGPRRVANIVEVPPLGDLTHPGARIYAMNCQACHGTGRGFGPIPALNNARSLLRPTDAARIILNGRNSMPAWRRLRDEDIASVTNFLVERFATNKPAPITAEQVRKLR